MRVISLGTLSLCLVLAGCASSAAPRAGAVQDCSTAPQYAAHERPDFGPGGVMGAPGTFGGTGTGPYGAAHMTVSSNGFGSSTSISPVLLALYGEVDGGMTGLRPDGVTAVSQVSFATEGADFDPEIDRDGRFIVYASTQHRATADIYRKSIDGRTVIQLTDDPADDTMPALSPDGTQIAFASSRSGNWDIYVMPVDGGRPIQVTSDSSLECHPTWSPDGKHIAFSRWSPQSELWELWVTRLDQPGVSKFVTYGLFPQWSPDPARSRILFQRPRERGSRLYGIWTIDYVNGEAVHPTEIVAASNAATMHPCWSPDGRRIAFTVVVNPDRRGGDWPERSEIWCVNVDGGERVPVVEGSFRNVQPCWGPDGRIYFVSNRNGVENIWAVAPLSGGTDTSAYASVDPAPANEP